MSCSCVQCRVNGATLGLKKFPASRGAIHRAYRRAAMTWHPDRFASEPDKIHEERFKRAQSAYRELAEHNPVTDEVTDAEHRVEDEESLENAVDQTPPEATSTPGVQWNSIAPSVLFANLPHCFVAPVFPPIADTIARQHLSIYDYPHAIFDLSGDGTFKRFLLLASHGIIFKDVLGNIALLRHEDIGNIELLNRETDSKIGPWQKLTRRMAGALAERLPGAGERFSLDLYRRDTTHFCSLTSTVIDEAKSAIYRYLMRKKQQFQAKEPGLIT
jgi:hypothetical protein